MDSFPAGAEALPRKISGSPRRSALRVVALSAPLAAAMPFRGRMAFPTYVDESLFGNPHEAAVARLRNTPAAVKETVLLSSGELSGMEIRAHATGREASNRQRENARLHALSNARKAKWPNTLEAARERKERARQEKLDAEETLRQEIDREEEALQAEKRRLVIERANKMLYDSTDRVKSLHSKLLLTDVYQEREQQVKLKSKLKQREEVDKARWHQKTQQAIRRMDAEEDQRDEEEAAKRAEVARIRTEQVQLPSPRPSPRAAAPRTRRANADSPGLAHAAPNPTPRAD